MSQVEPIYYIQQQPVIHTTDLPADTQKIKNPYTNRYDKKELQTNVYGGTLILTSLMLQTLLQNVQQIS